MGDKFFRLTLSAILGFGWIFLTPAFSDDPLDTAKQQIHQLDIDVQKLTDQAKTQELIDLANSKYDAAVAAKQNMQNAQNAYNVAVSDGATATTAKPAVDFYCSFACPVKPTNRNPESTGIRSTQLRQV